MALAASMTVWVADPAAALDPFFRVSNRTLVSVDSTGVLGNGASDQGVLSADGRFLAFVSTASNLVPGDTNQVADVFVKDLQTGTTERVSVSTAGSEGNAAIVGRPAISADGKTVAFMSKASNLAPGDLNASSDVFVRNLRTPATTLVSASSAGVRGNAASSDPSITADGRYVTFTSRASNLVSGDTNLASDVFLHDRTGAVTSLVSVDSNGGPANGASAGAEISSNGTLIAFDSFATDLVTGDTNNHRDVFRRDRTTSVTERVSLAWSGQTNGDSFEPGVSNDDKVVFSSDATNLGETEPWNADTNGVTDAFRSHWPHSQGAVWLSAGQLRLVGGFAPAISADGRTETFTSASADLVPNDTNGTADIFHHNHGRISADCTAGSGGQLECDLTANGGPAPTTVAWYLLGPWLNPQSNTQDFVHQPSLDNLTIVQLVKDCRNNPGTRIVFAAIAGGTGILAFEDSLNCLSES